MTTEQVGIAITIFGFIGTCFNVWLTARMNANIAELKNWVLSEFVRREDMPLYMGRLADRTQAGLSSLREASH